MSVKTGIIGFGLSGKHFHAQVLAGMDEYEITHVFSTRTEEVHEMLPEAAVCSSVDEIIQNPDIELVIITSPNTLHYPQTLAALRAGKHVVLEKPACPTGIEVADLATEAERLGKVFSVYHNRRYDGDFKTVKKLLADQKLGDIYRFESSFNRFRPEVLNRWREMPQPGSGLIMDLGPHLIDQCLNLFGIPIWIEADIGRQRKNAQVDDYFTLTLGYEPLRCILSASQMSRDTRRYCIQGSQASYIKHFLDPQEDRLRRGESPENVRKQEEKKSWGTLISGDENRGVEVPTEIGDYTEYYRDVFASITQGALPPVSGMDAARTIAIIEAAVTSDRDGTRIDAETWLGRMNLLPGN